MGRIFWTKRITIGAVFIMLLLNGCGNNPVGQNVTEAPEDIESLTAATPVTADEYGKYIEKLFTLRGESVCFLTFGMHFWLLELLF